MACPALGYVTELTEGGSAAAALARAFASLRAGDGQALLLLPLAGADEGALLLVGTGVGETVLLVHFNELRWGGTGEGILLLALRELSLPQLIGIGDFLEVQWSELVALLGQ